MDFNEMTAAFDLVAHESSVATRSESRRWEKFMRFICGEPIQMTADINPVQFGFELQEVNPSQRVVVFRRGTLVLFIAESFDDGKSYCECRWEDDDAINN